MNLLFFASGLFLAAFVIHIIIWKMRPPIHQKSVLLIIFSLVLLAGTFAFRGAFPEHIRLWLFYISFSLAYIITYSAIEADSPSLTMVMAIAKAGSDGLSEEVFKSKINDETLLTPRIKDLLSEGLAHVEGSKYRLTRKGILTASIFILYRKMLGREQKGG